LVLLFAVAASLIVIAGCGGGSSSSAPVAETGSSTEASDPTTEDAGSAGHEGETIKGLYIEKADAICQSFKEENAAQEKELEEVAESEDLETPAQEVKFSRLMAALITKSKEEGAQISELNVPSEDQDIVDKWIGDGEEANVLLTEANEALEAGEPYKFAELFKEGVALSLKGHGVAQGYGFRVCGAEEE
jgi:hypothetical protein